MHTNLFIEGLNLMALGIGFVACFLVFLIFAVKAMSYSLSYFHVEPTPSPKGRAHANKPSTDDKQLIAVIAAAIHHKKIK